MRRKIIRRFFIVLILLIAIFLVIISFSDTITQEASVNNKLPRVIEENSVTNQAPHRDVSKEKETLSIFYRLSLDTRYHYEFRYELNPTITNGNRRLMLVLYGAKRICDDLWDFSVGMRILKAIHSFGYSVLAICSQQLTYDINMPITNNSDAKYIYLSLQIWMKTVYYARFKQYPLLYIHSTSRGSRFAGILCRVLPIQAQLLYTYPGDRFAMQIPSSYNSDMQRKLFFNSAYANWFYFDFCFNQTHKKSRNRTLCPFNSDENYLYPLPPTFFTCLKNDPHQKANFYQHFISSIFEKSQLIGGTLLTHAETLQLDILPPTNITVDYMQKYFHPWRSKPHAARWFFEHFTNPDKYEVLDETRQTCWCSKIDFKYFELLSFFTMSWSKKKQQEYSDYIRDIRSAMNAFCEEVCGDLMATHSMVSRNINYTLSWIDEMDELRRSINVSLT